MKGQIPLEAELLTITIDRQGAEMWFVIRAWGILWDHADRTTWSALVDWGEAVNWTAILERCGHVAMSDGHTRRFVFQTTAAAREYIVSAGLADCGFEQQAVWDFCMTQSHWLSPSKGGDTTKTHGDLIRINKVMDEQLDLVWYWSDFFAAHLYFDCIKDGSAHGIALNWWLPTNIDAHYRKQLTDEYLGEVNGKRMWLTRTKTNHLGDCEKLQRVLAGKIEEALDEIREARTAEDVAAKKNLAV